MGAAASASQGAKTMAIKAAKAEMHVVPRLTQSDMKAFYAWEAITPRCVHDATLHWQSKNFCLTPRTKEEEEQERHSAEVLNCCSLDNPGLRSDE